MVIKPSLNWWTTYLDFIAKGCQGVYLQEIWILDLINHRSIGKIKNNGSNREEAG